MKICKDGRIWGQNNKEAGEHLGVLKPFIEKDIASESKRGKNNPNYKDGRSLCKKYCKDCGKQLSNYRATYCAKCMLIGEKCYNWKGGITPIQQTIRTLIDNCYDNIRRHRYVISSNSLAKAIAKADIIKIKGEK